MPASGLVGEKCSSLPLRHRMSLFSSQKSYSKSSVMGGAAVLARLGLGLWLELQSGSEGRVMVWTRSTEIVWVKVRVRVLWASQNTHQ